jgi:hypothetical protein
MGKPWRERIIEPLEWVWAVNADGTQRVERCIEEVVLKYPEPLTYAEVLAGNVAPDMGIFYKLHDGIPGSPEQERLTPESQIVGLMTEEELRDSDEREEFETGD